MARTQRSRFAFAQSGAAAVEYAVILPVFLVLVLGIMDTGRLLWAYTTLNNATEAAARCYAINAPSCTTSAAVQTYAVTQAWGLTISASAFAATTQTCGAQVSASYVFTFVIPWFSVVGNSNSMTLTAVACYPS